MEVAVCNRSDIFYYCIKPISIPRQITFAPIYAVTTRKTLK